MDVLIDSGADENLMDWNLAKKLHIDCEPLARPIRARYEVQEQAFKLIAGIVRGLSHPVVLGQDVLILPELVQSTLPVSMVPTRSQTGTQRLL